MSRTHKVRRNVLPHSMNSMCRNHQFLLDFMIPIMQQQQEQGWKFVWIGVHLGPWRHFTGALHSLSTLKHLVVT